MKKLTIILGLVAAMMASEPTKNELTEGKNLTLKCVACHGVSFEKLALGKSVVVKGQDVDAIERSLLAYKAGTQNKSGMGAMMKGQLATTTPEQIKIMATYIASMK